MWIVFIYCLMITFIIAMLYTALMTTLEIIVIHDLDPYHVFHGYWISPKFLQKHSYVNNEILCWIFAIIVRIINPFWTIPYLFYLIVSGEDI